jgi:hypothetical protein
MDQKLYNSMSMEDFKKYIRVNREVKADEIVLLGEVSSKMIEVMESLRVKKKTAEENLIHKEDYEFQMNKIHEDFLREFNEVYVPLQNEYSNIKKRFDEEEINRIMKKIE